MNILFPSFRKYLTYFHFLLVGIVLLSWFSKYISDCHLKAEIIYAIKLIIYLSGFLLFFIHYFPKREVNWMVGCFFMYVITPVISMILIVLGFILISFTVGPQKIISDKNYTLYNDHITLFAAAYQHSYILRRNYFGVCQCHSKFIRMDIQEFQLNDFKVDEEKQVGYLSFTFERYKSDEYNPETIIVDTTINFSLIDGKDVDEGDKWQYYR